MSLLFKNFTSASNDSFCLPYAFLWISISIFGIWVSPSITDFARIIVPAQVLRVGNPCFIFVSNFLYKLLYDDIFDIAVDSPPGSIIPSTLSKSSGVFTNNDSKEIRSKLFWWSKKLPCKESIPTFNYQPLLANFSSSVRVSMFIPTIGSPRSFETSARTFGSL